MSGLDDANIIKKTAVSNYFDTAVSNTICQVLLNSIDVLQSVRLKVLVLRY